MTLNNKQEAFINEYLICWNASEAARRAGYNGRSNTIGSRLLTYVDIQEEIARRLKEKHLTADMVVARLSEMATSNIADFAHIKDSDTLRDSRDIAYLVKKFRRKITRYDDNPDKEYEEIELELYDAQAALEKVGRHLSLFTDRVEHSGTISTLVILPSKDAQ